MGLSYEEIDSEVQSLPKAILAKEGAYEVMTAYLQGQNGLAVIQECPSCEDVIEYKRFDPNIGIGASLKCGCGLCTTSFKGL